jgi:hypothetical protein
VPAIRAKRSPVLAVLIPSLLLLTGCANSRAVLLFEQPWWSTLGSDTLLRARLLAGASARGYLPRIEVLAPQERPVDQVLIEASRMRRGTVVVGPLLSYEWRSFVSRAPSIRFILIGAIDGSLLPPNALSLTFDRAPALRKAGIEAARAASAAGGTVGALVSGSSDLDDAEIGAFIAGASEPGGAASAAPPPIVSLPAAPEKAAVQAAIEQMRTQGVTVFLLGLGSMNPWALEVLSMTGGSAVVAGWASSRPGGDHVLLSVEENVPAGIDLALTAARRGERQVSGPVSVVTGSAPQSGMPGR